MACMSAPDANPPPPPPTLLPLPSPGKDVGDIWTKFPMKPDHSDSHSQLENVPSFKRYRNSANKPPNSGPLSPRNLMMNRSNLQEGKGTSHLFYKTRVCMRFLAGICPNGELCTFAHGVEDLRGPARYWQELVREMGRGSGKSNDYHKVIQRTKICKRYYIGEECPYGEKCISLHERPMKFKIDRERDRKSSAISIDTTGPIVGSGSNNEQLENKDVNTKSEAFQIKPVSQKTKTCSNGKQQANALLERDATLPTANQA